MDFFAIVGGTSQTVYRLDIEQATQNRLETQFFQHATKITNPNLVAIPFTRENFSPDETEVLEIQPFDLPAYIFDTINNAVGAPTISSNSQLISDIYCVFGYDITQDKIIFQVIPKSQRLSNKTFNIILGQTGFTELSAPGLIISESCHAVYENSCLKFKSLFWLKQIFDITSYYRVATEADVDSFAQTPSIKVDNLTNLKKNSGQWARTRIAYILDSGVLTNFPVTSLVQKAASFNLTLQTVNEAGVDKILIPDSPKDLRNILKFLEEEYYEGPITGVAYETNNKRLKS